MLALKNGVQYKKAIALKEAGQYEEAAAAFMALGGYKDSAAELETCKTAIKDIAYNEALALREAGQYEEAIAAFEALKDYKDSHRNSIDCKYLYALALKEAGEYEEAAAAFEALGGYKDSGVLLVKCKLLNAKVNDIVTFGSYDQDDNQKNGKEAIEWIVLEKQDSKIFVISKYALATEFGEHMRPYTWEHSSLRKWLNHGFFATAFNTQEQKVIAKTVVSADINPKYNTDPGNSTEDKVFLLSVEEVEKYFPTEEARRYEITESAHRTLKTTSGWALRTPGSFDDQVAYVVWWGEINFEGKSVWAYFDIRPAMWIDLSA